MPATNKVGTQLLVRPEVETRVKALALVRQEAQAETFRVMIDAYLPVMESNYAGMLEDMRLAFATMKVDETHAVRAMMRLKIRYADLFTVDGKPKRKFPGVIIEADRR